MNAATAARLASVPGVRAAIGDDSVPVWLGGRATVAHGWASAALTPYVLSAGRAPSGPNEVVSGYPTPLGARVRLISNTDARTVTVVGVARPRHAVGQSAIFLSDAEAERLAGHPGWVDAIGVLAAPGFDTSRLNRAAGSATVLTGNARGRGEYPELLQGRTQLIAVAASFGGLALFISLFVVASTMGLSIQQREREIALLRAVAATPGQIRRMIAWEAAMVGFVASAAGVWFGAILGEKLGHALVRHGIAPSNFSVKVDALPIAAAVGGGVITALLAVLAPDGARRQCRPRARSVRLRWNHGCWGQDVLSGGQSPWRARCPCSLSRPPRTRPTPQRRLRR